MLEVPPKPLPKIQANKPDENKSDEKKTPDKPETKEAVKQVQPKSDKPVSVSLTQSVSDSAESKGKELQDNDDSADQSEPIVNSIAERIPMDTGADVNEESKEKQIEDTSVAGVCVCVYMCVYVRDYICISSLPVCLSVCQSCCSSVAGLFLFLFFVFFWSVGFVFPCCTVRCPVALCWEVCYCISSPPIFCCQ